MQVVQTSPTTFELTTDNGCITMAGFSTATMGAPGVYWHRETHIHKAEAEAEFRKDPRVQAAIEQR